MVDQRGLFSPKPAAEIQSLAFRATKRFVKTFPVSRPTHDGRRRGIVRYAPGYRVSAPAQRSRHWENKELGYYGLGECAPARRRVYPQRVRHPTGGVYVRSTTGHRTRHLRVCP